MSSHGIFCWNELNTRDAEAAKAFYGATLGWSFEAMPMTDGTYWVAKAGDKSVAGLFTMQGEQFDGIPEHWFPYIAVDDVDARVNSVGDNHGTVLRTSFDVPGIGRIAIVRDANGAALGLMTPAEAA